MAPSPKRSRGRLVRCLPGHRRLQKTRFKSKSKGFWGAKLKLRESLVLKIPAGSTLRIAHACVVDGDGEGSEGGKGPAAKHVLLALRGGRGKREGSTGLGERFRIGPEGVGLPLRLPGVVDSPWSLEALPMSSAPSSGSDAAATSPESGAGMPCLHLLGYFLKRTGRRQPCIGHAAGKEGSQQKRPAPSQATPGLREVRLPAGWAGLSFKWTDDGRLVVTDVPKACFSSAAFGAAAQPQVSGVAEGDEIALINGETPKQLAERIATSGDSLNKCHSADPPHEPGCMGKLAPVPCTSCDLVRRHKELGLDVALQMWIKAVKSDCPITLSMASSASPPVASAVAKAPAPKRQKASEAKAPSVAAASVASSSVGPKPQVAPKPQAPTGPPAPKTAQAPPAAAAPKPFAVYNPLRPAAAAAGASGGPAPAAKPRAAVPAGPRLGPARAVGGFQCEDFLEEASASTKDVAKAGQEVVVKFTLRPKQKVTKVIERGEVGCRIGEAEVLDGWVDGNVDMEEVIGRWSRAVVGMRAGAKRRVHIPAKSGFRDGGGEAEGLELLWDVEVKKLK